MLETIDVLERRLRINLEDNNNQQDAAEEEEEDDDLFSPLHRVLYTHMLGEAYMTLATKHGHTFYYDNAAVLEEFASRAEAAFRSAVNLAALINLEATSQLRLLATCSLCRFLVVVRQRHRRARRLANKVYSAATLHSHHVSDASLRLLQLLRDSYMPVLSEAKRRAEEERGEAYSSDESSVEEEEGDDDEEEDEDEGLFDEDGNRIGDDEGEGEGEGDEGEEAKAVEEGEGEGQGEGEGEGRTDPPTNASASTTPAKKTSKSPAKPKPSPSPSPSPAAAAAAATPSKPKGKDKDKAKADGQAPLATPSKPKGKDKDKGKSLAASTGKGKKGDKGSAKTSQGAVGKAGKPGAAASKAKGKGRGSGKEEEEDGEGKECKGEAEAGGVGWMTPRQRKAVGLVRGLRRLVCSVPHAQPVLLQQPAFPQALDLRRALSRLFAVYVRGAGLPAHAGADYTVTVDGQRLNFSSYVLAGPYISWRGVCGVLRDFSLARLPSKSKAPTFPQIYDPPGAVREFKQGGQPPVTIKQAALLFLESSRSACPVLTLEEYKEAYKEISAMEKALALRIAQGPSSSSSSSAGGGGGVTEAEVCAAVSGPAGVKPHEAWGRSLLWAAAGDNDDWAAITSGLNFMQFLDFLGKLALVAYSSPKLNAALPSPAKKVEHFLVAQMGLGDARRWLPKVDARIFALKYSIEKLTSAAVAAHPAAAAATTQALLMARTQQQG